MPDRTSGVRSAEGPVAPLTPKATRLSALPLASESPDPYYRNFLREELAGTIALPRLGILRLAAAANELGIPVATFRDLRFYSEDRQAADGHIMPGNGFARAFLKLGRALYVDLSVFVEIWREQQPNDDGALVDQHAATTAGSPDSRPSKTRKVRPHTHATPPAGLAQDGANDFGQHGLHEAQIVSIIGVSP